MTRSSYKSDSGPSFTTPLRYPGGKGRLGPWLGSLIEANDLAGGCYIEPYAGGAGAALYLLMRDIVSRIVINDADPVIHAFWDSAVNHPISLVRQIRSHAPTMRTRNWAKRVILEPEEYAPVEVAFATFFLNRTSRSGILNAGVIGGKNQAGDYKLDARYNRDDLIARIRAIAARKKQITVRGDDALDLVQDFASATKKKTLLYLDPPYYIKGSQLYRNFYEHADHVAIAEAVKASSTPILVTYDDAPQIRQIYKGLKSTLFSLQYSTHLARPLVSEVMFYANLRLPMPPLLTRGANIPGPGRSRNSEKRQAA